MSIWQILLIPNDRMILHVGILGLFTMAVWPKSYDHRRNPYEGAIKLYPRKSFDNTGEVIASDLIESCYCCAYDDLEIL